jgi:hypothetical protein
VFECTQGPGEVVYVPRMWAHATLNLADTVCLACEFTNDLESFVEQIPFRPYRTRLSLLQRLP